MGIADRLGAFAFLGGLALGMTAVSTGAQQAGRDGISDPTLAPPEPTIDAAQTPLGGARPDAQDGASAQFREADTDASGAISPEEWQAWRDETEAREDSGRRTPAVGDDTWEGQAAASSSLLAKRLSSQSFGVLR